jgi:hypothetical protein
MEINSKRLVSPERVRLRELADMGSVLGKMKNVNPARLEELRDTTTMLDPRKHESRVSGVQVEYVEMDNTNLTVKQSAGNIRWLMDQVGGVGKKGEGVEFLGALAEQNFIMPQAEEVGGDLKGDGVCDENKRPKAASGLLTSEAVCSPTGSIPQGRWT